MAEMTTEQLLKGLGQAVMAIGGKIDTLTEKMDAILSVLAEDIAPALKVNPEQPQSQNEISVDLKPMLDKLEEIKELLNNKSTVVSEESDSGNPENSTAVIEKLQAIEKVLTDNIFDAIKGISNSDSSVQIDFGPVIEKLEALSLALADTKNSDETKVLLEKLEVSIREVPRLMTDKLTELKKADTTNPTEVVEQKLGEVSDTLAEILKSSQDREFISVLSTGISDLKGQFVDSEKEVITAVKEIPTNITQMGYNLTASMNTLADKTAAILEKADKKLDDSNEKLGEIKEELHKGLELNTNMTSQMVDLTARFTDQAEEDRVKSLNTSAVNHFNRGEFPESETLFQEALEIAPDSEELLCNFAYLKAAMEKIEESEELFRKALKINPELEVAVSGLGMLMVKTGRSEETIEFLKNIILNGEPSVRTVVAYTRALAALGQHDKAVELLESTQKAVPNNPDILVELAKYGHEVSE